MRVPSSLARRIVDASESLAASRLVRFPPASWLSRVVSNRLVPGAVKLAFVPGDHVVNGLRLTIPGGSGLGGEPHMALGTYERAEIRYLATRLKSGGGMVDVGAHIGYFTLHAARAVGQTGFVLALEPTPRSAEVLRHAVRSNDFDGWVTVVEAAASSAIGTGVLHTSDVSPMFNTLEPDVIVADSGLDVRLESLDHLLEAAGWPHIDIVKMDVEGHEAEVLRGAHSLLERYPDVEIMFELSGAIESRHRDSMKTVEALQSRGFEFYMLSREGWPVRSSEAELEARMRLPRWQDSLFNVVASRKAILNRSTT